MDLKDRQKIITKIRQLAARCAELQEEREKVDKALADTTANLEAVITSLNTLDKVVFDHVPDPGEWGDLALPLEKDTVANHIDKLLRGIRPDGLTAEEITERLRLKEATVRSTLSVNARVRHWEKSDDRPAKWRKRTQEEIDFFEEEMRAKHEPTCDEVAYEAGYEAGLEESEGGDE